MKTTIFLLLAITTVILPGCKKEISTPNINGKWELSVTYGGVVGIYKHPDHNGKYFIFNNGNYESYDKGLLQSKGIYKVVNTTNKSGEAQKRILFDNENLSNEPIRELNIAEGLLAVVPGDIPVYDVFKRVHD